MTQDDEHPALEDHPTDSDYIGVEKRRADVSDDAEAAERARERFDYGEDGEDSDDEESAQSDTQRLAERVEAWAKAVEEAEGDSRGDMSHRFGRYAGSLSGTDYDQEIDESAPQDHDGRAETRTGFNPSEAPLGERSKWRRLNKLNDGWRSRGRDTQNNKADQRRYVDTMGASLGLTEFQKERAKAITKSLNMSHMAHYSSQQVVLAIISLVANEDGRWIRDEDEYREMMRHVGVSLREVKSIRQLVRQKSDKI